MTPDAEQKNNEKPQCTYTIKGPKIDRRGNVAWRRRCKNKAVKDGRCRVHERP